MRVEWKSTTGFRFLIVFQLFGAWDSSWNLVKHVMSDLARTEVSPHATSVNCISSLAILTRAGLCFDTASCDTLLEMLQPQHSWCFWPKASYFPQWFATVFLFSICLAVQNKSTQIAEALRIGNCPRAALKQQISRLPIVFHMALFCRNPCPYAHLRDLYTYLQYIIYMNCQQGHPELQWPVTTKITKIDRLSWGLETQGFPWSKWNGRQGKHPRTPIPNDWLSWVLFVAGIFVKFV